MPSSLTAASDPSDIVDSSLFLLSPIQAQALHKALAASHSPSLPWAPRGELAGAGGLQDQLEEVEAAVVSPNCSGKRFHGLEKGAGWVAVTGGRARPAGKQGGGLLWRVVRLPGWPLAVGPRDGKLWDRSVKQEYGQDWHFLSQPCTREAQP